MASATITDFAAAGAGISCCAPDSSSGLSSFGVNSGPAAVVSAPFVSSATAWASSLAVSARRVSRSSSFSLKSVRKSSGFISSSLKSRDWGACTFTDGFMPSIWKGFNSGAFSKVSGSSSFTIYPFFSAGSSVTAVSSSPPFLPGRTSRISCATLSLSSWVSETGGAEALWKV